MTAPLQISDKQNKPKATCTLHAPINNGQVPCFVQRKQEIFRTIKEMKTRYFGIDKDKNCLPWKKPRIGPERNGQEKGKNKDKDLRSL